MRCINGAHVSLAVRASASWVCGPRRARVLATARAEAVPMRDISAQCSAARVADQACGTSEALGAGSDGILVNDTDAGFSSRQQQGKEAVDRKARLSHSALPA